MRLKFIVLLFLSRIRVKVNKDLLLASDSRLVSVLVLLDLSAAFDTINKSILLLRLQHVIGIKGTALDWFKLKWVF